MHSQVGRQPAWHVVLTGPRSADQRREALDFVAVSLGHRPGAFSVVHHCLQCGSADHGVPTLTHSARVLRWRARHPGSDRTGDAGLPAVSFSRASGWLATAWVDPAAAARGWRIGVDLEEVDNPAFATAVELGAIAFSPDEAAAVERLAPAERPAARAALWCLKESVVKALGTGFAGDPAGVRVTAAGALTPQLPGHPEAVVVTDGHWPGGPVGEGLTGVVCLVQEPGAGRPADGR